MAFTPRLLPGGIVIEQVFYAPGRWLLLGRDQTLWTTSDFVDFVECDAPFSSSWMGACSDGDRWYAATWDFGSGLYRSTDGLIGQYWEPCASTVFPHGFGEQYDVQLFWVDGVMLAASSYGFLATSTDDGVTWIARGTVGGTTNYRELGVGIGTTTWIVCAGTSDVRVSSDQGVTWSPVSPGAGEFRCAAAVGDVLVVSPKYAGSPRISTDGGATWTTAALPPELYYIASGRAGRICIYGEDWPTLTVRSSLDMIEFADFDMSGIGLSWVEHLVLGDDELMAVLSWGSGNPDGAASSPYPADPGGGDPPSDNRVIAAWDIEIIPAPETRVELAWDIAISTAAHVSLEWQVQVISDAAVGGLDGAGGWPAVPSGRWAPIVIVGDEDLSACVVGVVSVRHTRRESAIAEFVLHSPGIDLMGLPGQRVAIGIAERTTLGIANPQVVFNGVIQAATVDLETGDVSCTCSDMLQEAASAMTREQIDDVIGGRWHQAYFGEPADSREYLEQCIQTVPADYARALDGSVVKLPWWGVGLRTASVRLSDYWSSSMQLTLPTRDEMLTRCVVKAEYRYTRMWGRGALVQYAQPLSFFLPYLALGTVVPSKLWLTKSMIEGAISSVDGWRLVGPLSVASPRAQTINIGTELSPFMYNIRADVAPTLALSFSALMATRWAQSVTEYYEINVVSSDLEALVGRPVSVQIGATLTAAFDLADWVSDWAVPPLAVDGSVIFPVGDIIVPYQPAGAMPADRDAMLLTMLDVARCDRVMQSARSGRLTFEMPLRPDMWLDRFVSVETAQIHASGPVHTVEHTLDSSTGDASSRVTLAVGLHGSVVPADPDWSLPTAVDTTPSGVLADYSFTVGTYVGGHPSSPPFDPETMVGFITNYEWANTEVEFYEHGLEIQSPAVSAAVRDPVEFPALASIDIEIPMFEMEIL